MSKSKTDPRALELWLNGDGHVEFQVVIYASHWQSTRTVTISDRALALGDLIRDVAAGRTDVTTVDRPDGIINWGKGDRQRAVGRWATKSSAGRAQSIGISLPLGNGTSMKVASVEDPTEQFRDDDIPF